MIFTTGSKVILARSSEHNNYNDVVVDRYNPVGRIGTISGWNFIPVNKFNLLVIWSTSHENYYRNNDLIVIDPEKMKEIPDPNDFFDHMLNVIMSHNEIIDPLTLNKTFEGGTHLDVYYHFEPELLQIQTFFSQVLE